MNQLRWLDRIVDGNGLCDKIIEMFDIVPHSCKVKIITCLPEIMDDSYHTKIASCLIRLLEDSADLTVPILDSLVNLNLLNSDMKLVKERFVCPCVCSVCV